MSVVSLLGVKILNNPAPFTAPYEFEITFECLEQLREDLEWKLTYVGSATSAEHDQELDSLLVGPIPIGVNKFIFEADPPNLSRLPSSEIIGVTVILLTCSYDGREFVRVGYYVNNEYDSEELQNDPPSKPIIERVRRNILAEKPRVTRFAIKWDSEESAPAEYPPDQPEADTLDDDGTAYGAEEADMQAALEKELEETDAAAKKAPVNGKQEVAEVKEKEEDEESEAGSEDLEEESSESDEDEEDEEAAEGEDTEMAEADEKPTSSNAATNGEKKPEAQPEVMVH
ncbi:Histone chaperone asf1 [Elasticomyces elasticus]|uniref:Histone chaperone n=1 Tax=Exophiala sideris TaxID=1016849 RepID=A0ABR0JM34_9EURO|nr:Histone chaperone asf1 [Elasticomyces elasticus]KAK5036368.1 Histone chaperone asf1 [Exophiala sideris]KAK5041800.1 Histone chaperone asf1 [Exophiala sideris]KAK5066752.1 Histone chaperone asf1 [Exophiala sideris]KAK5184810.1 Histone chaperone asf1 [Eurotiomycetes sp. CCFEE 6388]